MHTESRLEQLRQQAHGKLPPCMGWSTWNQFRQDINEALILETADAMAQTGLLKAGYRYLNLDDCWQASVRDGDGRLQFDAGNFPSREGLIAKLNRLGLRVGLYSSASELTCEDMPGSYGREETDAQTLTAWGVEYLKYDYCHVVDIPTDPHHDKESFPVRTPTILYIGLALRPGEMETRYPAADASLSGSAYPKGDGVSGLCRGEGGMEFTVTVPQDGIYFLSVGYEKAWSPHRQFAELMANGEHSGELWFPPSSGWSPTGRVHTQLQLRQGVNRLFLHNPMRGQKEDSIRRYRRMGKALRQAAGKAGPSIAFSVCEHGRTHPWAWAGDLAASWRTGPDISPNWQSVVRCYEQAVDLWEFQRPGAYNDPDMLEVGVGSLTTAQSRAHFTLWCMLCAPLILGCDIRQLVPEGALADVLPILTNPGIIALNQDPLLLQAKRVSTKNGMDILTKPLWNGNAAVCFFHRAGNAPAEGAVEITSLSSLDNRLTLPALPRYYWEELWSGAAHSGACLRSGPLAPGEVSVFLIQAK